MKLSDPQIAALRLAAEDSNGLVSSLDADIRTLRSLFILDDMLLVWVGHLYLGEKEPGKVAFYQITPKGREALDALHD